MTLMKVILCTSDIRAVIIYSKSLAKRYDNIDK